MNNYYIIHNIDKIGNIIYSPSWVKESDFLTLFSIKKTIYQKDIKDKIKKLEIDIIDMKYKLKRPDLICDIEHYNLCNINSKNIKDLYVLKSKIDKVKLYELRIGKEKCQIINNIYDLFIYLKCSHDFKYNITLINNIIHIFN